MSKIFRWMQILIKKPVRFKWILIKATAYSLWAEIFVILNMKHLLRQSLNNVAEAQEHTTEQLGIIRDVGRITRILGRRAPWDPMCLNLAYVAKKILREYNIESTFRLGYLEGQAKDKMEGHAWITIKGKLVTGWLATLPDYVEMTFPKQKK